MLLTHAGRKVSWRMHTPTDEATELGIEQSRPQAQQLKHNGSTTTCKPQASHAQTFDHDMSRNTSVPRCGWKGPSSWVQVTRQIQTPQADSHGTVLTQSTHCIASGKAISSASCHTSALARATLRSRPCTMCSSQRWHASRADECSQTKRNREASQLSSPCCSITACASPTHNSHL